MSIENSQIVWPVNFVSTVIAENKILPNSYTINISIIPLDNIQSGISTGYKKIKYFLLIFLGILISVNSQVVTGKAFEMEAHFSQIFQEYKLIKSTKFLVQNPTNAS